MQREQEKEKSVELYLASEYCHNKSKDVTGSADSNDFRDLKLIDLKS